MRAVNTVSLNGNAWQIESDGCQALAAYLKSAEVRLAGDPDREEILADLEQAIADKLARHVSAHKNVVSAEEITLALQEMGPVEAGGIGADSTGHAEASTAEAPRAHPAPGPNVNPGVRHLFQIREGAMLSGVCTGLAAYFGIDVTLVRVIFVVFTVLTGGIGAAVYLVMMVVVPVAVTAEQMAAAHGKPFNAEELIGRHRTAFTAGPQWRQQWRDQRRMWRDQRREWRRQRRAYGWQGARDPGQFAAPPVVGGPAAGILHVLLLIAFLVVLVHAATGRPVLGWDWAADVPRWVGIVAVCVIYGTLAQQLRLARYYGHVGVYHPGHALVALIGTVVWLLVLLCVGWYVVHHWPEVQDFLQRALQALQTAFDDKPGNTVST